MSTIKVITFVGTSLFENFCREVKSGLSEFETLADQLPTFDEWYDLRKISQKMGTKVTKKNTFWRKDKCSAEVGSLIKIAEEFAQPIEVHLIATDTVLSVAAALLIKQWFNEMPEPNIRQVHFDLPPEKSYPFDSQSKSRHIIKNLNFRSGNDYETGLLNLRKVLDNEIYTAKSVGNDCLLNITAGYKAIIPMTTLLAHRRGVGLLYMYNEQHPLTSTPLIEYDLEYLAQ